MSANIVMLLALIAMIGIFIWLFRDGEGTIRTGRLSNKLSDSMPGAHIRIKATPPEDAAEDKTAATTASTEPQD